MVNHSFKVFNGQEHESSVAMDGFQAEGLHVGTSRIQSWGYLGVDSTDIVHAFCQRAIPNNPAR